MKLPLIAQGQERSLTRKEKFELAKKAQWERYWRDPPVLTVIDHECLLRTQQLAQKRLPLSQPLKWLDVGCGRGFFTQWLTQHHQEAIALDISKNALKHLPEALVTIQGCLPYLRFEDTQFDGIICMDVIAEIDEPLHRLALSELARVIKRQGWLLCSTPLDIHSIDPLTPFMDLIRTEFDIIEMRFSFHRLYFYLRNFFSAPKRFVRASKDPEYLAKQLRKRKKLAKYWFKWNSNRFFLFFWKALKIIFSPCLHLLNTNATCLRFLENISETLWGRAALTHVILVGQKRPLF